MRLGGYFCLCASSAFILGFVYKIGNIDCVHAEGLAWILSPLYFTHLVKGSDYAGHPNKSLAKESVHSWGVSPGWGQRFTWHPTSPVLLVSSVVVSCWSLASFPCPLFGPGLGMRLAGLIPMVSFVSSSLLTYFWRFCELPSCWFRPPFIFLPTLAVDSGGVTFCV